MVTFKTYTGRIIHCNPRLIYMIAQRTETPDNHYDICFVGGAHWVVTENTALRLVDICNGIAEMDNKDRGDWWKADQETDDENDE